MNGFDIVRVVKYYTINAWNHKTEVETIDASIFSKKKIDFNEPSNIVLNSQNNSNSSLALTRFCGGRKSGEKPEKQLERELTNSTHTCYGGKRSMPRPQRWEARAVLPHPYPGIIF